MAPASPPLALPRPLPPAEQSPAGTIPLHSPGQPSPAASVDDLTSASPAAVSPRRAGLNSVLGPLRSGEATGPARSPCKVRERVEKPLPAPPRTNCFNGRSRFWVFCRRGGGGSGRQCGFWMHRFTMNVLMCCLAPFDSSVARYGRLEWVWGAVRGWRGRTHGQIECIPVIFLLCFLCTVMHRMTLYAMGVDLGRRTACNRRHSAISAAGRVCLFCCQQQTVHVTACSAPTAPRPFSAPTPVSS